MVCKRADPGKNSGFSKRFSMVNIEFGVPFKFKKKLERLTLEVRRMINLKMEPK